MPIKMDLALKTGRDGNRGKQVTGNMPPSRKISIDKTELERSYSIRISASDPAMTM